jgi:hypothetical protein
MAVRSFTSTVLHCSSLDVHWSFRFICVVQLEVSLQAVPKITNKIKKKKTEKGDLVPNCLVLPCKQDEVTCNVVGICDYLLA